MPIESTSSEFNPILEVVLSKGVLQLCSRSAIYSYGSKYDNFFDSFKNIESELPDFEEVLVLGGGLCSIPQMLEENFKISPYFTVVEIDEEVNRLADEYIVQYLQSPIQFIQTDAYHFMMVSAQKFDLICIDIFEDDKIPEPVKEIDFLKQLKKALNKNGRVLYNCLNLKEEDKIEAEKILEHFKKVFPNADFMDTSSNKIISNKPFYK